ncbi:MULTISPECIES: hypothetical protein [Flavobacterium]|uniref:Lipoprotein n=2 Tax=Flavobacterium ginsengisoli TaxID=871694 RepID=A0ABP7EYB7_9FLAO|nr:hypothetical protein [Flavobacterium sp. IB48]MBJ2122958.1 hypothetical protein [Flavobacterium sp. IB48]
MKFFKYILIVVFVLFLTKVCNRLIEPETVMIAGEEVSLENPWRKPTEAENLIFSKLVFSKELDKCEDLFLKEIYKNTYIAACKKANKKWNFYYVMPYENDITGLSSEVEDDITPPN